MGKLLLPRGMLPEQRWRTSTSPYSNVWAPRIVALFPKNRSLTKTHFDRSLELAPLFLRELTQRVDRASLGGPSGRFATSLSKKPAIAHLGMRKDPMRDGSATDHCAGRAPFGRCPMRAAKGELRNTPREFGGPCRIRTYDQLIKSQLLYQLS